MFTAGGYQVLIRGFRVALIVRGLRPHTIDNYVREAEQFAAAATRTKTPNRSRRPTSGPTCWTCRPGAPPGRILLAMRLPYEVRTDNTVEGLTGVADQTYNLASPPHMVTR